MGIAVVSDLYSYKEWHRALVPVNYDSTKDFSSQCIELNDWLNSNIGRVNFIFPIDQLSGYWTFYLKNKEDVVRFTLTWA